MKIAVVGAGISGIASAQILREKGHDVVVFEKGRKPGGLVRCDVIDGHLFHRTGGHVFNAKDADVSDWFWSRFDRDKEFIRANRNAKIFLDGKIIGYPIENYLHALGKTTVQKVIHEILTLSKNGYRDPLSYENFEVFLKSNFGETLYHLYFNPYNQKIWKFDLSKVPLAWLEGKLPMPRYEDMLLNNIVREEESSMVHSTFYYARHGGSQFIVDRLSEGLNIRCNAPVAQMVHTAQGWRINGTDTFKSVVYTGDIRALSSTLKTDDPKVTSALHAVSSLKSNGTSNMLCETDDTDISWLYLPGPETRAHRIIYTGNFSNRNDAPGGRKSCVVEFSGQVSPEEIKKELSLLPGNLRAIAYNYEPNSYVVQESDTRQKVDQVKDLLQPYNFFLTGRFAEWEYYNMDKAIKSAFKLYEFS